MADLCTFIYLLKPIRPDLMGNASPEEDSVLSSHFEYLQRALDDGKLVLAGPCEDAAFGIVLFKAPTEQEAAEFMSNDPAVKGKLMTAALHPFRISLVEKR